MSLFIKVSSLGREDRFFTVRSLTASLYEDDSGMLTTEHRPGIRGQRTLFSVVSAEGAHYLYFARENLPRELSTRDRNGGLSPFLQEVTPQGLIRIDHELLFQLGDAKFVCMRTPELATVLSEGFDSLEQAEAAPLQARAFLSITLAHTSKTLPLIEGASITVGSHEHDTVTLQLSGITERHIVVYQGQNDTTIRVNGGAFAVVKDADSASNSHSSEPVTEYRLTTGEIQLLPSQVIVSIHRAF